MRILVVNAGSSSVKLSLVGQPGDQTLAVAELDHDADGGTDLGASLTSIGASSADAVGHRVVHGGARQEPTIVNDGVLKEIEALDELAPLHNRAAAGAIRDVRHLLPDVPHVACFDTAFHASLPEAARRYALPDDLVNRFGIRRYGFHGMAVAWVVERTSALLGRHPEKLRLVVAHLGSGASVSAVAGGRSVATSMGMTPYEGLVMGTRAGSVDPGILLHLMRHGIDADALADALAHRGGIAALAGIGGGMRAIEAAAATGDERALLAIDVFVTRAAAEIASAATSLDRLDGLAFSGGIGEGSSLVRSRISARLAVLGLPPLAAVEEATDRVLSTGPGPAVVVIHAREDLVMSRLVHALVTSGPG
jgi:acetate kinase